jgi:hypothetical protein
MKVLQGINGTLQERIPIVDMNIIPREIFKDDSVKFFQFSSLLKR